MGEGVAIPAYNLPATIFKALDKNKDNSLDNREIKPKALEALDGDNNGKVSLSEMKDYQGPPIYLNINGQRYVLGAGQKTLQKVTKRGLVLYFEEGQAAETKAEVASTVKKIHTLVWVGQSVPLGGGGKELTLKLIPYNPGSQNGCGSSQKLMQRLFGKNARSNSFKEPAEDFDATVETPAGKEDLKGAKIATGGYIVKWGGKYYFLANPDSYSAVFGIENATMEAIEANHHKRGIVTSEGVLIEIDALLNSLLDFAVRYQQTGKSFAAESAKTRVIYIDTAQVNLGDLEADDPKEELAKLERYLRMINPDLKEASDRSLPKAYRDMLAEAKRMALLERNLGSPDPTKEAVLKWVKRIVFIRLQRQLEEAKFFNLNSIDFSKPEVVQAMLSPRNGSSIFFQLLTGAPVDKEDLEFLARVSDGDIKVSPFSWEPPQTRVMVPAGSGAEK